MASEPNSTQAPPDLGKEAGAAGADPSQQQAPGGQAQEPDVAAAVASVAERLREVKEYFSYYLAAKTDALRHSLLRLALYAALGLVALLVALAVVATAAVLMCLGIAEGIDRLVGSRWIGDLAAGLLIIGVIGGGGFVGIRMLGRYWFGKTRAKYEARRQEQRRRFGHDVNQRAQGSQK